MCCYKCYNTSTILKINMKKEMEQVLQETIKVEY
jgi:hypothetical protein